MKTQQTKPYMSEHHYSEHEPTGTREGTSCPYCSTATPQQSPKHYRSGRRVHHLAPAAPPQAHKQGNTCPATAGASTGAHSPLPDASALDKALVDQINILKHDLAHWKDDHEKLSRLAANEIKKRMDAEANAQRLADALKGLLYSRFEQQAFETAREALAQWEGGKQ